MAKASPEKAHETDTAAIGVEKRICDATCELWCHIPAAVCGKVMIGLIFLRCVSAAFERLYNGLVAEDEGDENDRDICDDGFAPEGGAYA